MGTKFRKVVCDEHGIGGSGENFANHARGQKLGKKPPQNG
jgi:hypothetical protein